MVRVQFRLQMIILIILNSVVLVPNSLDVSRHQVQMNIWHSLKTFIMPFILSSFPYFPFIKSVICNPPHELHFTCFNYFITVEETIRIKSNISSTSTLMVESRQIPGLPELLESALPFLNRIDSSIKIN